MDEREGHLLLLAATWPRLEPDAIVSHETAGVLHNLPLPRKALDRVTVTADRGGSGHQYRSLRVRGTGCPSEDVTSIQGYPVTNLARTAADLARELNPDWAVAVLDAALRAGLSPSALTGQLDHSRRRPGNAKARAASEFADPRAESPGESLSRWAFALGGVPTPELQHEVWHRGRLVGRSDFGWPEAGVLGEFDGRVKYGRLLRPGQSVEDVVVQEKRREQELVDLGYIVIRWLWADLARPDALCGRVLRALERGRRMRSVV